MSGTVQWLQRLLQLLWDGWDGWGACFLGVPREAARCALVQHALCDTCIAKMTPAASCAGPGDIVIPGGQPALASVLDMIESLGSETEAW